MNFSDTELMMLEQLTYLGSACELAGIKAPAYVDETVGARVARFTEADLGILELQGNEGQQWAAIIRYIKGSEKMCNLVQGEQFRGPKKELLASSYYYKDSPDEAIVTFHGTTTPRNWHDNGTGLGTSDTVVQLEAYDYIQSLPYDDITVVGHSKGGNLAQYTTIRSDKVGRCISMDGQGFSQEFLDLYVNEIKAKGQLITNYSLTEDFVHPLLKPIPNAKQDYCLGDRVDSTVENHFANSFFQYVTTVDENGLQHTEIQLTNGFPAIINGQQENELIAYIRDFTVYVLDTMPVDQRVTTGDYFGNILKLAMTGQAVNGYSNIEDFLMSDKKTLGMMIAYLAKFIESNKLSEDEVRGLLSLLGMNDLLERIDTFYEENRFICEKVFDGADGLLMAFLSNLGDGEEDKIIETLLGWISPDYKAVWQEAEDAYVQIPDTPTHPITPSHGGGGHSFGDGPLARLINMIIRSKQSVYLTRNFSDAAKEQLLGMVKDVENEKWSDFTDWIGDRWYDFESWIGTLNIRNYIDNVNAYHKKVIDKNNATAKTINDIFNAVHGVDSTYANTMNNIETTLAEWLRFVDTMSAIVEPGKGRFNSDYLATALNPVLKDISTANIQSIKDSIFSGIHGGPIPIPIIDPNLLLEYIKKNPSEMTTDEKQAVFEVLRELKDVVATFDSLVSIGNENLGVDVWNVASWVSDSIQYGHFSAISAHINDIYVNVLDACLEQGENSNTFAAALIKICNGENALNVLGLDCSTEVGKIFGTASLAGYVAKWKTEHTEHYFGKAEISGTAKVESKNKIGVDSFTDWAEDKLKEKGLFDKEKEEFYLDKDGNEIKKTKDTPEFYDRKATIAEARAEAKGSVSIYDGAYNIGDKGKVDVTVGEAEAHASISGGFYVIGADGEKKFSPGVKAEIGTSVTVLDGQWEQQWLGDENFGLNTDVGVTVGKAEAKADVTAQIFGEDGKLNLQVGASASAEAIAAEAKGSVGVNVLGGEVGVTGGVNFGIGAHADVGYRDGVFKCDVGASLGVGVSLDIEIDVGGMVDGVCDTCKAVGDFAEDAWNGVKDGWKKLWSW